jgi:hypothetical protein
MHHFKAFLLLLLVNTCSAQMPATAHTNLYFPHLADGGPLSGQWQTRFTFINPNSSPAKVTVSLYTDGGGALPLDLGAGPTSAPVFTIPQNGTYVLQSRITSSVTATGWAYASASLPVQANVAFRLIQNGVARVEITAEPTLPSIGYRSIASPMVGIAIANVYDSTFGVNVTVYDASGQVLGQGQRTVPSLGHISFNLSQLIPNLPATFTGSLVITPQLAGNVVVAWAVYADSAGALSSLPDGRAGFPLGQPDQVPVTFSRVINAYQTLLSDFGVTPQLIVSPDRSNNAINAHAANGSTVQVNLALAELMSDSPSELAFVIAHEVGHIYQQRTRKLLWYSDPEWDADAWGLLVSLLAGYDPYAGAGALGKLAMASGTANLGIQLWEDLLLPLEAHGSFSTRIDNLTTFVKGVCGYSTSLSALCNSYKTIVHPHFPSIPTVPLSLPSLPASDVR